MQGRSCGLFNCSPIYYYKYCGLIIQFNVKLTDIKKDFLETDNAKIILMSKNWTDTIPMFQYLYKARISYLAYIGEVGKKIQKDIVELIQSYQKYMTTEQVCLLEELSSMQIFAFANQFKQINISLEDKNGKESIVGFFSLTPYAK